MASLQSPADTHQPPVQCRLQVRVKLVLESLFTDNLQDGRTIVVRRFRRLAGETICGFDDSDFLPETLTAHTTLTEHLIRLGIHDLHYLHGLIHKITSEVRIVIRNPEMNGRRWAFSTKVRKREFLDLNRNRDLMHRVMRESMTEFERNNYGMVPASGWAIEKMLKKKKKLKTEDENQNNCVICLEDIGGGTEATSMPCSHQFHDKCIVRWLKQSHSCPVCRYEMPT